MTTWIDVINVCHESFLVHDSSENEVEIEIANMTNRSQKVLISKKSVGNSEWISMYSRFCKVSDAYPEAIFSIHSKVVESIFGIQIRGDYYGLVFSMPLSDFDFNEFIEPLQIIVDQADEFEKIVTGKDNF